MLEWGPIMEVTIEDWLKHPRWCVGFANTGTTVVVKKDDKIQFVLYAV